MQDCPNCGSLTKPRSCHLRLVTNQPEIFQKIFLENNQIFGSWKKLFMCFHIWKNACHRNFIQFSVRIELYDKKCFIYGNCMIRIFGQPGYLSSTNSKFNSKN